MIEQAIAPPTYVTWGTLCLHKSGEKLEHPGADYCSGSLNAAGTPWRKKSCGLKKYYISRGTLLTPTQTSYLSKASRELFASRLLSFCSFTANEKPAKKVENPQKILGYLVVPRTSNPASAPLQAPITIQSYRSSNI